MSAGYYLLYCWTFVQIFIKQACYSYKERDMRTTRNEVTTAQYKFWWILSPNTTIIHYLFQALVLKFESRFL